MTIIIDNGSYHLRNLGDVAMFQVAVRRLVGLFPRAHIHVITHQPSLLARFCPGTLPVAPEGRDHWFDAGIGMGALKRRQTLPRVVREWAGDVEQWIKHLSPELLLSWRNRRDENAAAGDANVLMNDFVRLVSNADLVIASGRGYITDEFAYSSIRLLGTLRLANAMGKATAMFGQGIGPVASPALLSAMRASLEGARVIGVRETSRGPAILKQAGVADDVIHSTGDDAVELALPRTSGNPAGARRQPPTKDKRIGLNLRCVVDRSAPAQSTPSTDLATGITTIISEVARAGGARITSVPISHSESDGDERLVDATLRKIADAPRIENEPHLETPAQIVDRVATCRVVVTGSYHAAVFALAQGIPAIGLARSEYYFDKFAGLFEEFGVTENVVRLDQSNWRESLRQLLQTAWADAERLKPSLLAIAREQLVRGLDAYQLVAVPLQRLTRSA
jgi:colanic acid/amylovoran biosynthesis protein